MAINPKDFVDGLSQCGVNFFAGVPDSLLSDLSAYIHDHYSDSNKHIITANEGNAIALASGFHLSTGELGAVYLQNSGLGNVINPLTSLTDPEVYRIPMILIIGWRGQPGVPDEPQHIKQGRITEGQLKLLEIPYWRVNQESDYALILGQARETLNTTRAPVALLIEKGSFTPYEVKNTTLIDSEMRRESAIRTVLENTNANDLIVSTTGKTSRELYESRLARGESARDFLTVGSMGHTLSIAAGVALGNPSKRVICLDGDGSMLMHMGSMAIVGCLHLRNLIHIVFNNGAHESVGGQPTVATAIDLRSIATSCNYSNYYYCDSTTSLAQTLGALDSQHGAIFIEARCAIGSRPDLGRPKSTPADNKTLFTEIARER